MTSYKDCSQSYVLLLELKLGIEFTLDTRWWAATGLPGAGICPCYDKNILNVTFLIINKKQ